MIQADSLKNLSGIRHGFFTREGGHSSGIYASKNTGLGSHDDRETVMKNRDAVADDLEAMYATLTGIGCRVVACTFPLPQAGLTARVAPRLQALNERIRVAASRHGVFVAELEPLPMAADLRLWANDRIHLNPEGHARLAAAMFSAFAQDGDTSWQAELPAGTTLGRLRSAASEAK